MAVYRLLPMLPIAIGSVTVLSGVGHVSRTVSRHLGTRSCLL